MNKQRLELFSDGVFAIILTLLVLDLHTPAGHGLEVLAEVWPALLVHAASFLLVGMLWIIHHGSLERVTEMTALGLRLNLFCLLWPTLIPYGAKCAAERPLEPFGPSLMSAATGIFMLSVFLMRLNLHSTVDDKPELKQWRKRRFTTYFLLACGNLLGAVLAWFWPWAAYGAIAAISGFTLFASHPAEVERGIGAAVSIRE